MEFQHTSVLLEETIEYLKVRPDGVYVDGTLGGGGHASRICQRLGAGGRLIGLDQDDAAIAAATERLKPFGESTTVIHSNYEQMREALDGLGIDRVDGILLDLGVSSYQLDDPERGFTYRMPEAALDMRMDRRQSQTARDIVNGYSEQELCRIIRDYGEDRFARSIARHIVQARNKKPIETAGDLNEAIRAAIPARARAAGGHPSKRTFQAIRIELNRELTVLANALDEMTDLLRPGGRICVITFHSLEDRIVKCTFKKYENPCICPADFPVCVCGAVPKGRVVNRKPILPGAAELARNTRSKSAKLRVFERGETLGGR